MTICSMQVDDEAIAAMDDDAAAHWKRYVGESSSMDRGMLERVLRFVCAHLNSFFFYPVQVPLGGTRSTSCLCMWNLSASPGSCPNILRVCVCVCVCVCDESSRPFGTVNMLTSPC